MQPFLGCAMSHSPLNRKTNYLLFILALFAFLFIFLLDFFDLEKICTVCNEIWDFI